jgi:hypothetical protein
MLNKKLKDLIPSPLVLEQYRFLDVLDSTRFNTEERKARLLFRLLMAKVEVLAALITGDGISISENILMDSAGFIQIFGELCQAAQKMKLALPLRLALRGDPKDAYYAAAAIFARVGDVEKKQNRFKLSAWADLDEDKFRRLNWAKSLESQQKISNQYVLPNTEEAEYAQQLNIILAYVNSNLAPISRVIRSRDSVHIFKREIDQIATLDKDKIEAMLRQQKLGSSPIVQQPWFKSIAEKDAAIEIVEFIKELRKKGEINNRTKIHDELENLKNHGLVMGIIEVTDSIYNFSLGYATLANESGDTVHHIDDPENSYVLAGNSLSRWAMETGWSSAGGYDIEIPWGLYMPGQVGWKESLRDKDVSEFLRVLPWDACFVAFIDPKWQASLAEYKFSVAQLQTVDRIIASGADLSLNYKKWEQRRDGAFSQMTEAWGNHFELSKKLISNSIWKMTDNGKNGIELGTIENLVVTILEPKTKISPDAFKEIGKLFLNYVSKSRIDKSVSSVVSQIEDSSKPEILEFR